MGCDQIKNPEIVIPKKKRQINGKPMAESIPVTLSKCAYAIADFIANEWPEADSQIEPFQFNRTSFSILFTSRSHYCKIKERMTGDPIHHSNHIFFIADLRNKTYAQRCHNDQSCSYISEDGTNIHLTSDHFPFSPEVNEMIDQLVQDFYRFADDFIFCFES